MHTPSEEINRAFNLGSDARVHGVPQTANPYAVKKALGDTLLWQMWNMGWKHVNASWNVDNRRHVARQLPGVRPLPWK